ncbi:MAG: GtrA family protein [Pseudomonadota bacterium]
MHKLLSKFIIVGAIGFIIDLSVYLLLVQLGLSLYVSRILAFIFAVQATYTLNKQFTFSKRSGSRLHYIMGQASGIGINYVSFVLFYNYIIPGSSIIAFVSGSAIALFYNFTVANVWVFKK